MRTQDFVANSVLAILRRPKRADATQTVLLRCSLSRESAIFPAGRNNTTIASNEGFEGRQRLASETRAVRNKLCAAASERPSRSVSSFWSRPVIHRPEKHVLYPSLIRSRSRPALPENTDVSQTDEARCQRGIEARQLAEGASC